MLKQEEVLDEGRIRLDGYRIIFEYYHKKEFIVENLSKFRKCPFCEANGEVSWNAGINGLVRHIARKHIKKIKGEYIFLDRNEPVFQ